MINFTISSLVCRTIHSAYICPACICTPHAGLQLLVLAKQLLAHTFKHRHQTRETFIAGHTIKCRLCPTCPFQEQEYSRKETELPVSRHQPGLSNSGESMFAWVLGVLPKSSVLRCTFLEERGMLRSCTKSRYTLRLLSGTKHLEISSTVKKRRRLRRFWGQRLLGTSHLPFPLPAHNAQLAAKLALCNRFRTRPGLLCSNHNFSLPFHLSILALPASNSDASGIQCLMFNHDKNGLVSIVIVPALML